MKDAVWMMFNQRIEEAIAESNWYSLGIIYYEMAHRVQAEGTDSQYLRDHGYNSKLKYFSEYLDNSMIEAVEIYAQDNSCDDCRVNNQIVMSAEDARLNNPIPVRSCDNEYGCRCTYMPIVD